MIFIILLILPLNAHAIFQKVYKGYQSSDRLQAILVEEKIYEADYKLGSEKYNWSLNAGYQNKNSFLQSLFSFQSQKSLTQTTNVGLEKSSYKFGTFSLNHQVTQYDLSEWSGGSLSTYNTDEVYEYRNSLNYTYEILNRSNEVDWDLVQAQYVTDKVSHSLKLQADFLDFFQAYSQAKLNIILDGLYKEFEKRAQRRVNQVARRVRDGLSRKLELDQARISLLNQQETILTNKNDLRQKVALIEEIIGIKIPESEYQKLVWTYKKKDKFPSVLRPRKFPELKRLEALNKITDLNLVKVDEQINSSLSLNLSYTINAFNSSRDEALTDAMGAGNRDEKVVALNYTLPLGFDKTRSLKEKLLFQRNKNELEKKNLKGDLEVNSNILLENLNRLDKAISLNGKKIKAANHSIKEHQKLYLRGQVSFEELLRAEETYINARISRVNLLSLYDLSLAQLAFIGGNIKKYLDNYTD